MVYIAGVFSIYLCKFYCQKRLIENDARKVCIIFSFSVLCLISALRGFDVGIDTHNYAEKFNLIQKYTWAEILSSFYTERMEIGYALLNKLVGVFSSEPRSIIIVNSCIICYAMAYFVYHFTDSDCTAIMLFICTELYFFSFNIMRQMIAVILLMNAWGLLKQKKYRWSLVLFFLCISIHVMSIIFAAVYFFYFIHDNKKLVAVTFFASLLIVANYRVILSFIDNYTDIYSYLDNSHNKVRARGIWALWAVELIISAGFLVSYLKSEKSFIQSLIKNCSVDGVNLICVPIFVVYYILFTYLGTQFNYLDRIGVFFMPFTIILFLDFGKAIRARSQLLYNVYLTGLHVCFLMYFLLIIQNEQYQYSFLA